MAEAVSHHGQCYCGHVKFQVTPTAKEAIFPLYCHCDSCRRAHSAPLYNASLSHPWFFLKSVVYIPKGDFHYLEGEDQVQFYQKDPLRVQRSFCKVCGSKVTNTFPPGHRFETHLGFFPSLLDEATQKNLPDYFRAKSHYHADSAPVLDPRKIDETITDYVPPSTRWQTCTDSEPKL